MICSRCKGNLVPTGKKWKYSAFIVELFRCQKCRKNTKIYYRNGKISHIISNHARIDFKIKRFLKEHTSADVNEISEGLNLSQKTVIEYLLKLAMKGDIEVASSG